MVMVYNLFYVAGIRLASILLNVVCNYIHKGYFRRALLNSSRSSSSKLAIFKSYSTLFILSLVNKADHICTSDMSYAYSLWSKNYISYWIIETIHVSSILVWFRAIRIYFSSPFLSRSDLFIILLLYPSVILSVLWVLILISARVSEHVWIYSHTLVPTYFIFTGII